jgi:hypothetical protein
MSNYGITIGDILDKTRLDIKGTVPNGINRTTYVTVSVGRLDIDGFQYAKIIRNGFSYYLKREGDGLFFTTRS